jgi:hypothetical protein
MYFFSREKYIMQLMLENGALASFLELTRKFGTATCCALGGNPLIEVII